MSTVPTQYVSGGFIQPAIIAPRANNNSPSGQDVAFDGASVVRVLSATEFEINSGISTRAHLYARGGRVDQLTKIVIDDYWHHPFLAHCKKLLNVRLIKKKKLPEFHPLHGYAILEVK